MRFSYRIADAQRMFFDRKVVRNAVDRRQRKALSKFGAFVRRTARSSIRGNKKSKTVPGRPPKNRTGRLRKFLYFAYEPANRSVVIGPALLNGTRSRTNSLEKLEKRFPFMLPAFDKELPNVKQIYRDLLK